jgi:coenzyme F420-0:L-glutamate ligase/coenzyme F420-1:gamma-L-glutamate ligase
MILTLTPLAGIPRISPGDDLVELILESLIHSRIELIDNDILVITQKVVSKSEGRLVNLRMITPSQQAEKLAVYIEKDPRIIELILGESEEVLRYRPGTIIVQHRLGFVCANAGIDHSNVTGERVGEDEWVLLLPLDPDRSAQQLRHHLELVSGKTLGVMIIDSHGRAWRMGTTGVAIGIAGIPGLVDLRGKKDLFDYELRITQVGAADELAAAASLVMGQADEGTPVIHIRGFPYPLRESSLREVIRPKEMDLFR